MNDFNYFHNLLMMLEKWMHCALFETFITVT